MLVTVVFEDSCVLVMSRPSIVEFSWRHHLLPRLASNCMKEPRYVLRGFYGLVGGWEVFTNVK
jgi:hypothetical protein